jgi:hypothetical protein
MDAADKLVADYEDYLESLVPSLPCPSSENWHLRLIWMPSFQPERIFDIWTSDAVASVAQIRFLESIWSVVAQTNQRPHPDTIPSLSGTTQLANDHPLLAQVQNGLPFRLTEPDRIGCDGEIWICSFKTQRVQVRVRAWSPQADSWLRLIDAVGHAASMIPAESMRPRHSI